MVPIMCCSTKFDDSFSNQHRIGSNNAHTGTCAGLSEEEYETHVFMGIARDFYIVFTLIAPRKCPVMQVDTQVMRFNVDIMTNKMFGP